MIDVAVNTTLNNIDVNVTTHENVVDVVVQPTTVEIDVSVDPSIYAINDPTLVARVTDLENLSPINILEDVILGNLETVSMPVDNPLVIGIIQQIDESDGNKVYYPNFTTTPDERSAIFTSVLTQLQNKIVIWPRKPFL